MKTEEFVKLMTGHFDNAQHVNTVCNDKINNIPEDSWVYVRQYCED